MIHFSTKELNISSTVLSLLSLRADLGVNCKTAFVIYVPFCTDKYDSFELDISSTVLSLLYRKCKTAFVNYVLFVLIGIIPLSLTVHQSGGIRSCFMIRPTLILEDWGVKK